MEFNFDSEIFLMLEANFW